MNLKRILAMIGVFVLLAIWVAALILIIVGDENIKKAAVYTIIVIPVLLWAYAFIYRLLKNNRPDDKNL